MLVRLSDPAYQTELIVFLRNSGILGSRRSGADMQVTGIDEAGLGAILDTWRSLQPQLSTEIVADP